MRTFYDSKIRWTYGNRSKENYSPASFAFLHLVFKFPSSPLLGMVSLTRLRWPLTSKCGIVLDVRASFCLYRLTITDSDGATNSTTAALIIRGSLDYPPVANAGPNQTITLPQNTIILNGNQSSDDHQIVLYEWFPDPGGESKEMVMQASPLSCLQSFILSVCRSSITHSSILGLRRLLNQKLYFINLLNH